MDMQTSPQSEPSCLPPPSDSPSYAMSPVLQLQLLSFLLPVLPQTLLSPSLCPCHLPCLKDIFLAPYFIFPSKPSFKIPSMKSSQMIQLWALSVSSKNNNSYFQCHPSGLWHKLPWSVSSSVSTSANSIY